MKWEPSQRDSKLNLVCFPHVLEILTLFGLTMYLQADARSHIEIQETRFNWGPEYKDDGTMYVPNPGPTRYAGDPHEFRDINQNWEDLIEGMTLLFLHRSTCTELNF